VLKTCGEVVNAALDLSQLDGSNMLTYSRMIYLLNSAYGRLYDFITDQTEDWGSLQCVVSGRVEVPRDLLKVRGVYRWDGVKEGDEMARVDHEPENGQYWMHGEELICGGHPGETFLLRYYPEAATITFPCKPEPTEYVKIYDNYLASVEGSAIRVVNLRNGEDAYYDFTGTLIDFVLVHGVPAWLNDAHELHYGCDVVSDVAWLFQDKWGDFAFGYTLGNGDKYAVEWDGIRSLREGPWFHSLWDAKYRIEEGSILRAFYEEPDNWEDITDTIIDIDRQRIVGHLVSSPYLILSLESRESYMKTVIVMDNNNSRYEIRPMVRQGNTPPVKLIDFDHNDENGYGIIYTSRGQREIAGFTPDTALDYPKTIYFDWLEAELAKLFMIEARQDVSVIDALAGQYWSRLMEDAERQSNYAYKLRDRRGALNKRRY
jgi:hypothetical protein